MITKENAGEKKRDFYKPLIHFTLSYKIRRKKKNYTRKKIEPVIKKTHKDRVRGELTSVSRGILM